MDKNINSSSAQYIYIYIEISRSPGTYDYATRCYVALVAVAYSLMTAMINGRCSASDMNRRYDRSNQTRVASALQALYVASDFKLTMDLV